MDIESYYYNCSRPYIESISPTLYDEIIDVISKLPKKTTQSEVNKDLFWILTSKGWSYDTVSPGTEDTPPADLAIEKITINDIRTHNNRDLCLTSTTIEAKWHADFAQLFDDKLVQVEAQFGKVESMFKDFCGFKIGQHERRLALGIVRL